MPRRVAYKYAPSRSGTRPHPTLKVGGFDAAAAHDGDHVSAGEAVRVFEGLAASVHSCTSYPACCGTNAHAGRISLMDLVLYAP
ncbi:hypothetical protein MTER_07430 [Mycolicibacter terrae]|uniref:Uncharacterized protein n=1 Tax=Mycolicibacter terrae TaxID=1788 RepID=A0AAD1HTS9_9MYCO|nr:hypothetical protein MTER_07430 [Mycolicibacter terrae]